MAIRYVDSNTIMDLGEKIRFKSKVEPVCGVDIPEHTLDALIEPQKTGIYCLRFMYKIADETWVDNYKIKVKG